MLRARVVLDKDFAVGTVDPRLFGGFVEHLGRCVYEGMYEPDHPTADADGFRTDVMELVGELNMSVMRYPGGNFVSGYNWEDGIGSKGGRPHKLDLAWHSPEAASLRPAADLETNQVGTNEFIVWCKKIHAEPMLAVNLGTRGPEAARNLVEYCNYPGGTYWSDQRKSHGYPEPHKVKLWCLGNEMDGPWQMCRKTAAEYGRIACETAKLMKWTDPSIELAVCGSSARWVPTFPAWESEVLEHCFDHVEYVSVHTYLDNPSSDTPEYLAKPDLMGQFIDEVVATCDYVAAKRRSTKRIQLSFDEWNVWTQYHSPRNEEKADEWPVAPHLLEDIYSMEDALVVGGMLIALLNPEAASLRPAADHADRVKIGCLAQVVNVIAPIMTKKGGPARRRLPCVQPPTWRQTIFYPFAHASNYGRGAVLRQVIDSPVYDTKEGQAAPYYAGASMFDPENGALTVFCVNRSLSEPLEIAVDLRGFDAFQVTEWITLRHDDLKAVNTCDHPDTVKPTRASGAVVNKGNLTAVLSPASRRRLPCVQPPTWNVIRLLPKGK